MVGVWSRVAGALEVRQRRAADYLNGRAGHWGRRELKGLLVVMVLLFGGGGVCVLWEVFSGGSGSARRSVIRVTDSIMRRGKERPDSLDMLEGIYKQSLKSKDNEGK